MNGCEVLRRFGVAGRTMVMLVVLAMVATACGSDGEAETSAEGDDGQAETSAEGDDGQGDTVTLTWWAWDPSLEPLTDAMKEDIPNVDIEWVPMPGDDLQQKLRAALVAGSGAPDILNMEISWIAAMKELEGFVDLAPYMESLEPDLADKFYEAPWQATLTDDGRQIALPKEFGPGVLIYRTDVLEEAGLPTEPDELADLLTDWDSVMDVAGPAIAEVAGDEDVWLFANATQIVTMRLSQLGWAPIVDDHPNLLAPEVKEAVTLAQNLLDAGYISGMDSGEAMNAAYAGGQIAFLANASFYTEILRTGMDPNGAGKWQMTSAPGGAFSEGGDFYAITDQSEHPELAAEVIHWFATHQTKFCAAWSRGLSPGAYIPNFEDAPCTEEPVPYLDGQVVGALLQETAEEMKPQVIHRDDAKVRSALTTATDEIFRGSAATVDVDEALAAAQQVAERDVRVGR